MLSAVVAFMSAQHLPSCSFCGCCQSVDQSSSVPTPDRKLELATKQEQSAFSSTPQLTGEITMKRILTASAIVGALGLGTTAYAATGQFKNMCTMGLASRQIVRTNCSVH